jgi:hypothetical protein
VAIAKPTGTVERVEARPGEFRVVADVVEPGCVLERGSPLGFNRANGAIDLPRHARRVVEPRAEALKETRS